MPTTSQRANCRECFGFGQVKVDPRIAKTVMCPACKGLGKVAVGSPEYAAQRSAA